LLAKPTQLNINLSSDRFAMFNKQRDIALLPSQLYLVENAASVVWSLHRKISTVSPTRFAATTWGLPSVGDLLSSICQFPCFRDVPLFVEHCEAVATEIDVKLRWLGEQARRGLSLLSGALPGRHVALEVACEPSVVGSLWLLPA
jgi:hypothetical protein